MYYIRVRSSVMIFQSYKHHLPRNAKPYITELRNTKAKQQKQPAIRLIMLYTVQEPEFRFVAWSSFTQCLTIQGCRGISSSVIRFSGSSTSNCMA